MAAGVLILLQWSLLVVFFVTQNETADLISNWVALPALVAIGFAMGAVLDRYLADAPVVTSLITAGGLLADTVALVATVALVLSLVAFPRIALPSTAAWVGVFLWVGAASGLILAYGGVPGWLGWLGVATIAYAVAIIGFMMRTPEARRGAVPPTAEVAAGVPVLLLVPAWLVCLGLSL